MLGIEVCTPCGIRKVKAAIIAVTCDLPARAVVLNMKQFNGKHGCHLCEDEGENSAANPMLRWWPHNENQKLRSKKSFLNNCLEATSQNAVSVLQHKTIFVEPKNL